MIFSAGLEQVLRPGLLEEIVQIFPGGLEQAVAQSGQLAEASCIKTENLVHIAAFGRLGGPAPAPPTRPRAGALPATGPLGLSSGAAVLVLTVLVGLALRRRRTPALR